MFTAADATTPEPITYNDVPSGFGAPFSLAAFEPSGKDFSILLATDSTSSYPAMPAAAVQSGDMYLIQGQSNGVGASVMVSTTLTSSGPVSLTFPAPWSYAGPTAAALPTMNFSYTGFSGKTGVSQSAAITWPTGTDTQNQFQITASTNYQNGSTSLTFPSLSGLVGFLPAPASGVQVDWDAYMTQSSAGFPQKLQPNMSSSEVLTHGQYQVP